MENLIKAINSIDEQVLALVQRRLLEFSAFSEKTGEEWFSELCFCILTANSRAITAIKIQRELGPKGFLTAPQESLVACIIRNNHRFHNNKAKYITEARKHKNVKNIVQDLVAKDGEPAAREWLVSNVKGLGYKEASHFLRNVGYKNLAILDRHILNLMHENNLIVRPKTLTKKSYLEIESKFNEMAKDFNMSPAQLDLTMWYLKTGEILK